MVEKGKSVPNKEVTKFRAQICRRISTAAWISHFPLKVPPEAIYNWSPDVCCLLPVTGAWGRKNKNSILSFNPDSFMCYASTGKSLVSAASDEMNAFHQTYCSLPLSADSFISRCFHTTFHYIFTLKFPDFSVDFWTQHKIKLSGLLCK